jgi:hypothetical protein
MRLSFIEEQKAVSLPAFIVLVYAGSIKARAQSADSHAKASETLLQTPYLQLTDAAATHFPTTACCTQPANGSFVFPTIAHRGASFLSDVAGADAFFGPAFQAAADQAQSLKVEFPLDGAPGAGKHPAHGMVPEWGEGFAGYEKRYAARFGMNLLSTSSRYAMGELLREDVTYHPCECNGILRRSAHAVTQSFVVRTRRGTVVPSTPCCVGSVRRFTGSSVRVVSRALQLERCAPHV